MAQHPCPLVLKSQKPSSYSLFPVMHFSWLCMDRVCVFSYGVKPVGPVRWKCFLGHFMSPLKEGESTTVHADRWVQSNVMGLSPLVHSAQVFSLFVYNKLTWRWGTLHECICRFVADCNKSTNSLRWPVTNYRTKQMKGPDLFHSFMLPFNAKKRSVCLKTAEFSGLYYSNLPYFSAHIKGAH